MSLDPTLTQLLAALYAQDQTIVQQAQRIVALEAKLAALEQPAAKDQESP